ncbi:MAG: hypothetical protein JRN53_06760, partial [Nitrososphaerota archaeon]|nr:hypothetical protein [Nitrososphaerota archaeon]
AGWVMEPKLGPITSASNSNFLNYIAQHAIYALPLLLRKESPYHPPPFFLASELTGSFWFVNSLTDDGDAWGALGPI